MVSAGVGAIIGAVIAAGAGAGQARMQQTEAKRARGRQEQQQKQAQGQMVSQKRSEARADSAANREQVDPMAMLAAEEAEGSLTQGRTRMSGAGGVDPEALRLGTAALLGE